MLEYEEAVERILAAVPTARAERCELIQANRRVVLETISSPIDIPSFDNSAMDGYAVRSADVRGATGEKPAGLRLSGRTVAGDAAVATVQSGECARVFTGSMIPAGADAVVMQEDTRVSAASPGTIEVLDEAKPWENIRFRGEDVKQGSVATESGKVLGPGALSLLAAVGLANVSVGMRPVVGILATGSELLEAGEPLRPGAIYESNRTGISAMAASAGGLPKIYPLVKDDADGTRQALKTALQECDLVVTSGGVSVGEMDFVKAAFEDLGGELQFWKVAIKPGRPFVFGRWQQRLLFGLPGNPVSAFVTFLLLARPAILRWQGAVETGLPRVPGTLVGAISNPGDRRHFVRVVMNDRGEIRSAGPQASHMLHSLALANGLLDVAPRASLEAGTTVHAMRWE